MEGQAYMVTYDVRADVVFEITEHAHNKGGGGKRRMKAQKRLSVAGLVDIAP